MHYDVLKPGEWIKDPKRKYFRFMCCDCGLIHRIEFKIVKKQIWLRMWRDNRVTAMTRRSKKIVASDLLETDVDIVDTKARGLIVEIKTKLFKPNF